MRKDLRIVACSNPLNHCEAGLKLQEALRQGMGLSFAQRPVWQAHQVLLCEETLLLFSFRSGPGGFGPQTMSQAVAVV